MLFLYDCELRFESKPIRLIASGTLNNSSLSINGLGGIKSAGLGLIGGQSENNGCLIVDISIQEETSPLLNFLLKESFNSKKFSNTICNKLY